MVKLFKIIVVTGEIWNQQQVESIKHSIDGAFSKVCQTDPSIGDLIQDLTSKKFNEKVETEIFDFELLCNPSRLEVEESISTNNEDSLILIYVGAVVEPSGYWILKDGLFGKNNIKCDCKLVLCTPDPSKEWALLNKTLDDKFILSSYELNKEFVEEILPEPFLTELYEHLSTYYNGNIEKLLPFEKSNKFINTKEPNYDLTFDSGSPCVPCLLNLDGFRMVINPGYSPYSEMFNLLKRSMRIDIGLLSQISANSILSMNWKNEPIPVNHIVFPNGNFVHPIDSATVSKVNEAGDDTNNSALLIDSYKILNDILVKHSTSNNGTHSCLKSNIKPGIILYKKVGYGSLEMIVLGASGDEAECKKYFDEWSKGKNLSDSRFDASNPMSLTCMFVWRPFATNKPIRRMLYVGSRFNVKKLLPGIIPKFHATYNWSQVATAIPAEIDCVKGDSTKPTKTFGKTPLIRKTALPTAKPQSASTIKKELAPSTARPSTARPSTARPNSAATTTKKPTAPTSSSVATTGTVNKKTPKTTTSTATKTSTIPKKPLATGNNRPQSGTTKSAVTAPKPGAKTSTKSELKSKEKPKSPQEVTQENGETKSNDIMVNGTSKDDGTTDKVIVSTPDGEAPINDSLAQCPSEPEAAPVLDEEGNKLVASVGTVECAITEHGEADFCDETPEELSADQMRKLGFYEDEEEKVRNAEYDEESRHQQPANLADLPMEGSFYGGGGMDTNWNQPLGLPMPAPTSTTKKLKPDTNGTLKTLVIPKEYIYTDHLMVPADLDKDDLKMLFSCVKSSCIIVQLFNPKDLIAIIEILFECGMKNTSTQFSTKIIPSTLDEHTNMWLYVNKEKMEENRITVLGSLSTSTMVYENSEESCVGHQLEL